MRVPLAAALAFLVAAAPVPARAHGASRGLHVHVKPEAASPGTIVAIAVDASDPIVALTLGFVGHPPRVIRPKEPAKHLELQMAVPEKAAGRTAGIQAEAVVGVGRTLRASALIRLSPR